MDDQLIIKLFYERSQTAIIELSEKYGKLCKTISNNILKNEQDAEECVNDALLAAWETIPPANPEPLQAYICRIVRNLSLKKYHSNTAKKRNSYYDVILDEITNCLESNCNVEDEILAQELADELNVFLSTLKVKERIIFVQRYWYCASMQEIADNVGMSVNTATVHLHRTRKKLKRYLERKGH